MKNKNGNALKTGQYYVSTASAEHALSLCRALTAKFPSVAFQAEITTSAPGVSFPAPNEKAFAWGVAFVEALPKEIVHGYYGSLSEQQNASAAADYQTGGTLASLKGRPIAGNFYQDEPLLNAIDAFVRDEANPMAERLEALALIDKVMGISCPAPTELDLAQYLEASS